MNLFLGTDHQFTHAFVSPPPPTSEVQNHTLFFKTQIGAKLFIELNGLYQAPKRSKSYSYCGFCLQHSISGREWRRVNWCRGDLLDVPKAFMMGINEKIGRSNQQAQMQMRSNLPAFRSRHVPGVLRSKEGCM